MIKAEQAALRLLSLREHSQAELRVKLQRAHATTDIDQVLRLFADQGLQSDERYTALYVESRRNKGYGPLRIRMELQDRGVDAFLIDSYIDQNDEIWPQLLKQVAAKKYGSEPPLNQQEMAKRGRFLSYRGFPAHLISAYLFNE